MAKSTTKQTSLSWTNTLERYVGFIDIMGFKDMVARTSHDEIYTMMQEINRVKNHNETVKWSGNNEKMIRSTFYSDSIILYSRDNSYDSAYSMLCTLSALTDDLLMSSIPHKGAMAFGRMTLDTDNSIFFGQPLIDAYILQEELAMYGIVVHSSVESEIQNQGFQDKFFFEEYRCPFKGGVANHLTVPPLSAGLKVDDDAEEDEQKLIAGIKKFRHRTSGHIRKYIDNTEAFIDFLRHE